MDVLTPRTVEEALALKAEHPEARFIQGGTDVMVELNFGHSRPPAIVNLGELAELRGWKEEDGGLRLGAGLTYTEAMTSPLAERLPALAEASRTVGSPQIRNRGTIGGNLGHGVTRGRRAAAAPRRPRDGGARERPRRPDDAAVRVPPRREAHRARAGRAHHRRPRLARRGGAQTFMKVGPRNAMVIAICSLAVVVDTDAGEVRAAFGSAAVTARLVTVPLADAATLPERVAEAASPIDDVRGTRRLPAPRARRARGPCAREVPPLVSQVSLTVNGAAPSRRTSGAAKAS